MIKKPNDTPAHHLAFLITRRYGMKMNGSQVFYCAEKIGGEFKPKSIFKIVQIIKEDIELKYQTEKVREYPYVKSRDGHQISDVEKKIIKDVRKLKCNLPAISLAKFKDNTSSSDVEYYEYFIYDFDDLSLDEKRHLKIILSDDPLSLIVGESARCRGLYQIIRLPYPEYDPERFKREFERLRVVSWKKYGVEPDKGAVNKKQLRFLSHDPQVYFNRDAKCYDDYDVSEVIVTKARTNKRFEDYSEIWVDPFLVEKYFLNKNWERSICQREGYIYLVHPYATTDISAMISLRTGVTTCFSSNIKEFDGYYSRGVSGLKAIALLGYGGKIGKAKIALGIIKRANDYSRSKLNK